MIRAYQCYAALANSILSCWVQPEKFPLNIINHSEIIHLPIIPIKRKPFGAV